ncbi:MAG: DUF2271 domain-containing protein [Verrucomicrobiota bacterium]
MQFKNSLIFGSLLLAWSGNLAYANTNVARPFVFHHENVLGTSLELKLIAVSDADARSAEALVLDEIDRLAGILSTYESSSEVSRWLKTSQQPVAVSAELFHVLEQYDRWCDLSGGAFNATAGVALELWKNAAARHRVPTRDELADAVAQAGVSPWKLDPAARTATRTGTAALSLNALGKGCIVDQACAFALSSGKVTAALVNIGGDLRIMGDWVESVGVVDPLADAENSAPAARLRIQNRAVATSGNYRRGFAINDRWYSHIVDPRTARPVDHVISATVVAGCTADADALSTTFSVLTPEESLRLASSLPEVEYLLVTANGRQITSRGWHRFVSQGYEVAAAGGNLPVMTGNQAGTSWNPEFELIVNLELNRSTSQRYRRPFVAVWVEDQDKFPVRTMALWFDRARWLPDLKAWYHGDQMRTMADGTDLTGTVSSATRPAGKYAIKWDGKDDKGKPVKPGKYTVCIEAVREHGTYQLIRQEMSFTGTAAHLELKGNPEVSSASLDYRRKTATH